MRVLSLVSRFASRLGGTNVKNNIVCRSASSLLRRNSHAAAIACSFCMKSFYEHNSSVVTNRRCLSRFHFQEQLKSVSSVSGDNFTSTDGLTSVFVKLENLPLDCTIEFIQNLFPDLEIDPNGITIGSPSSKDLPQGCAIVQFGSKEHAFEALKNGGKLTYESYIDVSPMSGFLYSSDDIDKVADAEVEVNPKNASLGPDIINEENVPNDCRSYVYMRGLPWNTTDEHINLFFKPLTTLDVILDKHSKGGLGVVVFDGEEPARLAMLQNFKHVNNRYIELSRNPFPNGSHLRDMALERKSGSSRLVNHWENSEFCVYMSGLPYSATKEDVNKFFEPLRPLEVKFFKNSKRGFCLAVFDNDEAANSAMKKHHHFLGSRYIELSRTPFPKGLLYTSTRLVDDGDILAQDNTSQNSSRYVYMRGLPYRAGKVEIKEFFAPLEPLDVKINNHFPGSGLAVFDSEESAYKAMQKHRAFLGNRYIELSRTPFSKVLQRSDAATYKRDANFQKVPSLLFENKYTILMTGLPYEASTEDIEKFFEPVKPVKIQLSIDGRAFAQFSSHEDAMLAMSKNLNYIGRRYVDLHYDRGDKDGQDSSTSN